MNVISEKPFQETGKGPNVGKHEGSQTGKDVSSTTDLKEVKYAITPVMSTYLLAFVVGPFEYIEAHTTGEHNGESVKVRVYALPGSTEQGRHALNVCTKALEYFAAVFGEPYPLPKMDMVAIPDFEAGAMENWGKFHLTHSISGVLLVSHFSYLFRLGHLPYRRFAL
jgi:aminopeptidase 2